MPDSVGNASRLGARLRQWASCLAPLALLGCAHAVEKPVNPHLTLYEWVRSGAAIELARVQKVSRAPGGPGKEVLTLELRALRTLWGSSTAAVRAYKVEQPAAITARLKFPDPVWGRVDPETTPDVLLVTGGRGAAADPRYVEGITRQDDPTLAGLSAILSVEARKPAAEERTRTYLGWLAQSQPVYVLFGAEALATDPDLAAVHASPRAAAEMGRVFLTHSDTYVRLSVGSWMWQRVWGKATREGRAALVNSALRGLEDANADIRRFSLEQLLAVGDATLFADPAVEKRPGTGTAVRATAGSISVDPKRIDQLVRHLTP
jgi:hypothetical protein